MYKSWEVGTDTGSHTRHGCGSAVTLTRHGSLTTHGRGGQAKCVAVGKSEIRKSKFSPHVHQICHSAPGPASTLLTRKTYYLHTAKNTHVAASTRSGALRSLCQSSQLYRLDHGGRCPHTSEAVRHDVSSRPKSPERRSRTPKPNAEAEGRRRAVL
jgi:hypothetical protein